MTPNHSLSLLVPKQDLPVWPAPTDVTEHPVFGYPVGETQLRHSPGKERLLCPRAQKACNKLRKQGWTLKQISELFEISYDALRAATYRAPLT